MSFLYSFWSWCVTCVLRIAFSTPSAHHAQLLIYWLGKVTFGFSRHWIHPEKHGVWVGEGVGQQKKEALYDSVRASDRVVLWVPGGGFRFHLGGLYIPKFIAWIRALEADKGMRCVFFISHHSQGQDQRACTVTKELAHTYDWLVETLQVPMQRLILGADDTGVAALLDTLMSRPSPHPTPRPLGLVCVSPYTGLEAGGTSWQNNASSDYITPAALNHMERVYSQDSHDMAYQLFTAPTRLSSCLPRRLLILVGGKEVLLDDAGYLAEKARAHGLEVVLAPSPNDSHLGILLSTSQDTRQHQRTTDLWVEFVSAKDIPFS
ncbi:hypothetical protein BDF14DRAFT_1831086 [Spinellus fusiger]|nr:hypothetical protein BDF14DRAFT_1831086 [Spinellus fusiger]